MLQVISKKFFKSTNPETFYSTQEKALVYSNMDVDSITTKIAKLERIESSNGICTYLMTYTNVIEKQNSSGFQLVPVGQGQIINDFTCCCTFWFNRIFSTDKLNVQRLIRKSREGIADTEPPRKILPNFFDNTITINNKVHTYKEFINDLIGLKREIYVEVIKVIRQYQDAVYTINSNLELSYTMFIATLESLAQKFDGYETSWQDCNEKITKRLNILFEYLPEIVKENIKRVIIEESHNKQSRRYEEFCMSLIMPEFYREDAFDSINPIRKSHTKKAIKTSYQVRSRYIHTLKELPDLIALMSNNEFIIKGKDVYLTFTGITRLCRFIIKEFINQSVKVDSEEYDYLSHMPDTLELRMAHKYWIHKESCLTTSNIIYYFNEFLDYITMLMINNEKEIVNLKNICYKIERIYNTVNDKNKTRLLVIYTLYDQLLTPKLRMTNSKKFIREREDTLNELSIENCTLFVLTNSSFHWSLEELKELYNEYNEKRFRKNEIKLPQTIEICLLLEIANLSIKQGNSDGYINYVNMAIEEKPGDNFILQILKEINSSRYLEINWKSNYFTAK